MRRRFVIGRSVALVVVTVAVVAALVTPVAADGVRYFGAATEGPPLNQPIVGIAATPGGNGYWLAASDGGVFAYGDARFLGSTGAIRLNSPIVGIAATHTGNGYWLVAADGGIFSFGDARFLGSTGAMRLNSPIVGMAATSTGNGYWLVAADGGIFAFGDAPFGGSAGGDPLAAPVSAIVANPRGPGYWLLTATGGVFAFGGAPLFGSSGAGSPRGWVTGMAASSSAPGYWIVNTEGAVFTLGTEHRPLSDTLRAAPSGTGRTAAIAHDVFDRINTERVARGIDPMVWDERLAGQANAWAAEMSRGGFRHQDLGGLLARPDYASHYTALYENIYRGSGSFVDAGHAHMSFMTSAEHRQNITQPGLTVVGIGAYCAPDGTLWLTQDFGTWSAWPNPAFSSSPAPATPVARPDTGGARC